MKKNMTKVMAMGMVLTMLAFVLFVVTSILHSFDA